MRQIFFWLLLVLALPQAANAQTFRIEKTDASAHPRVSLRIINDGPDALDKSKITLSENKKSISNFTLAFDEAAGAKTAQDTNGDEGTAGAVCFLVENGGFTSRQQVDAVRTTIANALRSPAMANRKVNVCYFNTTRATGALHHVSAEFTTNHPVLITDMNRRVVQNPDPKPVSDPYKAIWECLDFVGKSNLGGGEKQVILISTGMRNGSSPISLVDCNALATQHNIILNGIGLASADANASDNLKLAAQSMNGRYESGASPADIERAIAGFVSMGAAPQNSEPATDDTSTTASSYLLTYTSPAYADDEAEVEIITGGETQTAKYTVPKTTTNKSNKILYYALGGGALLLMLLGGLWYSSAQKKKRHAAEAARVRAEEARRAKEAADAEAQRQREEEDRRRKAEPVAPTMVPGFSQNPVSKPADPRTVVGGASLPELHITYNGQTVSHRLTGHAMSIGRDAGNAIAIPSPNVSRRHATIGMQGGTWYIKDEGSTNGVVVNGQRVSQAQLNPGTRIQMGDAVCTFTA